MSAIVYAGQGNPERGRRIYEQRCVWCHGRDGYGDGPAAEFLNPPPRDLTSGAFKLKSSSYEEYLPFEKDLFKAIKEGFPGTAMPGWGDVLGDAAIWNLVSYVKELVGGFEEPINGIEVVDGMEPSADGIEKGRSLFKERCAGCHGARGTGVATKVLKDDWGFRTWPRNLTKGWTFKFGNSPEEIYRTVTVGIPGTQMPSFSDPLNRKSMTGKERWYVANYVSSLNDESKIIRGGEVVIRAEGIDGDLPDTADDPRWLVAETVNLRLIPQLLAERRLFVSTNDTIGVKALYNKDEIAFLLQWDDRTMSIPGDSKALRLAEGDLYEDGVAVQFSADLPLYGSEMPYFGHGDSMHPVNIWFWKSGTTDSPQTLRIANGSGISGIKVKRVDGPLSGVGIYREGVWRVVVKGPRGAGSTRFETGVFMPVAFASWDGSNGETGSRHTMTPWYWLLLEEPPDRKVYVISATVAMLVLFIELFLYRYFRRGFMAG